LNVRYLVVNRVGTYKPPQVQDERTFAPGEVAIEGFLIDLKNDKVLCSFRLEVTGDDSLMHHYRIQAGGRPVDVAQATTSLRASAHFNLLSKAHRSEIDVLKRITGGSFSPRPW
jgi:hypothetical protein